jgi:hypothetical protein
MDLQPIIKRASQETRRLNPQFFGENASAACDRPTTLPRQSEKDLQAKCDRWLEIRGYRRRTSCHIQSSQNGLWYIHLPRTRGNPIVLDYLLLNSRCNRYLEAELKTTNGRVSPVQRCLVLRKEGVLCWGFEQFRDAVVLWEASCAESIA